MVLHTLHNFLAKFTSRQRSYVLSGPFGFVPAEILDLVISHLANDKAALMQCALVHPTWTRVSRHHLAPLTLAVSSRSHAKELTKVLKLTARDTLPIHYRHNSSLGTHPSTTSLQTANLPASGCIPSYYDFLKRRTSCSARAW
ncbi:hypothetical protein BDZ89DRAFT_380780 [Hymenopellis radicata]|nr:hypothetical protein BDZ89DRAFT_380780 [Hymenopellis radicata]